MEGESMQRMLFTAIGKRVQLATHFQAHGWEVIGVDANPEECATQRFVQTIHKVPRCSDPTYYDRLFEICREERVDCVIPLFEPELRELAKRKSMFDRHGIRVIVSDEKVLSICLDKYALWQFFNDIGILTPETYLASEDKTVNAVRWVIKPRTGMGGYGVRIAETHEIPFYIDKTNNPIIQRFIEGQEYSVDVFVNQSGQVLSVVPRLRMEVRAGEVSKSITVEDLEITEQTVRLVKKLGLYGPATIQGIREAATKKFYFIEVNPRFGGGVPLSIQAGIPYAEFLKDSYRPMSNALHSYQVGLKMLRYDEAVYVKE